MSPPLTDTWRTGAPRRLFASRGAAPSRPEDLAALADALLSPRAPLPVRAVPTEQHTGGQAARGTPTQAIEIYLMIPAGLDGPDRRRAAVAAAARLAPPDRPAACFLFEHGRADAHVLGRAPAGADRTVADLVARCDQVAVIALDGTCDAIRHVGPVAERTVFIAGPDTEGLLETYRGLKSWHAAFPASPAALFVVGTDGPDEAGQLHRRLARVARQCLGVELQNDGFLPPLPRKDRDRAAAVPQQVLEQAPAAEVWPLLVSAARRRAVTGAAAEVPLPVRAVPTQEHPARTGSGTRVATAPRMYPQPSSAPAEDEYRVFSPWTPEGREALLAAIEVQGTALAAGSLQQVFRIEVDEPGAPPLAAVRNDGALVAILVAGPGEPADATAARGWLAVHRRILARAYPCSGIRADAEPSAIVLAPVEASPMADGVRRFVAVRTGGHRGIVLVP